MKDYKQSANQIGGQCGREVTWKDAAAGMLIMAAILFFMSLAGIGEVPPSQTAVCKVK
jgi:hypothetical protein